MIIILFYKSWGICGGGGGRLSFGFYNSVGYCGGSFFKNDLIYPIMRKNFLNQKKGGPNKF